MKPCHDEAKRRAQGALFEIRGKENQSENADQKQNLARSFGE